MIRNLFEFGDTQAAEIMTPRIDLAALALEAQPQEIVRLLNHEKHTRIPVYERSVDSIVGILNSKDFMEWYTTHPNEAAASHSGATSFALKQLIRPPFFVPESKRIDELLREMRLTRNHMAVVVDEYGGTAGVVTIEDILEEIVGEIYDEKDEGLHPVEEIRPGVYVVDPVIHIADLSERLGIEIPLDEEHDIDTLGGLLQARLGAVPRKGNRIDVGPMQVRVLKVDGQRVMRALLLLPQSQAQIEEAERVG